MSCVQNHPRARKAQTPTKFSTEELRLNAGGICFIGMKENEDICDKAHTILTWNVLSTFNEEELASN